MDGRERYLWDLTGYLVVRGVLGDAELRAANAAIDFCLQHNELDPSAHTERHSRSLSGTARQAVGTDDLLFTLEKPHCDPFRSMLAHPQVVARLNVMCGSGFRFDHGPHFIGGVQGTEGLRLHGAGEPHRPYVAYHHQNGQSLCQGVTVSWNLADAHAGDGGFACVPGSHKSQRPMPSGVRSCDDDMGVVAQPELEAGDVLFFMDGALTHGTLRWNAALERRSILLKYASRTATRGGVSHRFSRPEVYWPEEVVEGMSDEQRAVMFGPCSAAGTDDVNLEVDQHGSVVLKGAGGTAPPR